MADPTANPRSFTDCGATIVIRPEGRGGVIFRCTRPEGHKGEHTNSGDAEGWPLVENTAGVPFLLRWVR